MDRVFEKITFCTCRERGGKKEGEREREMESK